LLGKFLAVKITDMRNPAVHGKVQLGFIVQLPFVYTIFQKSSRK